MPTLTIADKTTVTDRIAEFILVSGGGDVLPPYAAGAHVDISTSAGVRSYSLIDWPNRNSGAEEPDVYRIAVQREAEGLGGSCAMHELNKGDGVQVSEPANDFELSDVSRPVLLLAGGIGVTPLISMATVLQVENRSYKFHYSGRSRDVMAYVDELGACFGDAFQAHFDDQDALDLDRLMSDHADHVVYICGPRGMIDAARGAAQKAGVANDKIHIELFSAEKSGVDTAFEVELASSGQVVTVAAGQTIIEALEAAGLDVMYDCQRGDCGICQTDVVSGTPDHRDVVLSEAERESGKVMQICVSRSLSSRLVLDI